MREQLPATGFLRLHQIIGNPTSPGMIPISKSAWWEGIRTKRFPQPVKLGPRTTAWKVEEIRQYIQGVSNAALGEN